MSDKNLEEKFKEWHDSMPCENYHPYLFIFKAGYNLYKEKMEQRLKEAEELLRVIDAEDFSIITEDCLLRILGNVRRYFEKYKK